MRRDEDLQVFAERDVQDFRCEVEFAEWTVLDVVPENEPFAGVAQVVACAHEPNNVRPEKHFGDFHAAFEFCKKGVSKVVPLALPGSLTSRKRGCKFVCGVKDPDAGRGSQDEAHVVLVEVD